VHLPYEYVNPAGAGGTRPQRVRGHDLSLVLIFLTRLQAATEAGVLDLRPLGTYFRLPSREGDDGYACFSVCCHSCCAQCPGVRRGGSPDPTSRSKTPTYGPARNRYHFFIRAVRFFFDPRPRARPDILERGEGGSISFLYARGSGSDELTVSLAGV